MFILVAISILVWLAAFVWSLVLWRRLRDWRLGLFSVFLGGLFVRQALTYWGFLLQKTPDVHELWAEEAVALLTSIVSLACVVALGKMIGERERAAGALADHRTRLQREYSELRAIYDNAPIGMCTVDPDLRFTAINERLARINGRSALEHLGRTIRQVLPGPLADRIEPIYRHVLDTGEPSVGVEFRAMSGGVPGVERDWSVTHYPIRGPLGQIEAVGCTVTDITDQRRALDDVRAHEQRQRALLQAMPDAMFLMSRDGVYLAHSAPEGALLITPPSQFLGRRCIEVLPEHLGRQCMDAIGRTLATGAMQTYEYCFTRDDQTRFWEVRMVPSGRDEVLLLVRNITERRGAEEALRTSREDLERAQAVAHVGSLVSDPAPDGRLTWSAEACRIFGIEPGAFDERVQTFFDRVHPDDLQTVMDAAEAAVRPGSDNPRYDLEHRIVRPDGAVRWVREQADIVRDSGGNPIRMIGTVQDVTERKRTELLQASQNRIFEQIATGAPLPTILDSVLALVQEQAPATSSAIMLLDRDGQRFHPAASRGFAPELTAAMAGITADPAETPCGTAAAERRLIIAEDLAATTRWGRARALAGRAGLRSCWSHPIAAADGRILGTFAFFRASPGAPDDREGSLLDHAAHLAGIAIERRRAEEAVRESEERYRRLAEHGALGIWEVTPEGLTVYANPTMCRLLEVDSPAELRGQSYRRFFTTESLKTIDRELVRRRRGEPSSYEVQIIGAKGGRRQAVVAGAPMITAGRPLQTLVGTFTDITDRKRAEDALRESEERFRSMADSAPVLIWLADAKGQASYYNRTWLSFTGRTLPEELDHGWEQGLHPDDRDHALEVYEESLRMRKPFTLEYRFRRAGGTHGWLFDQGSPRFTPAGEFAGFIGSCTDITERRRLEDELRRSQKMEAIGQLASGVAHDFSNLLTAIFGFTSLARRTLSPQHPAVRSLDRVDEAARQAAGVSRALLTFSRGGASDKKPVVLGQLVEDALRLLRRTLPANIEVSTSIPRPPVWVRADATQLQQVLMNLAINARDAMPSGGRLTIGVGQGPSGNGRTGTATLSVSDTGVGMSPELRARIFEPFFTTKPPGQGTGLGLAIVHGIVSDHGGSVEAVSEPGQGSTFVVTLPTAQPLPEAPASDAVRPVPAGRGQIVLLADPHRYVREIVASMLESIGFQVVQAGACGEVQQALESGPIRAAVLDATMCGAGRSCMTGIRAARPDMKIIAITGNDGPAPETDENTTVLSKPFQMNELAAALAAALSDEPEDADAPVPPSGEGAR
jgi:PAS domain S-box-containing protein